VLFCNTEQALSIIITAIIVKVLAFFLIYHYTKLEKIGKTSVTQV